MFWIKILVENVARENEANTKNDGNSKAFVQFSLVRLVAKQHSNYVSYFERPQNDQNVALMGKKMNE